MATPRSSTRARTTPKPKPAAKKVTKAASKVTPKAVRAKPTRPAAARAPKAPLATPARRAPAADPRPPLLDRISDDSWGLVLLVAAALVALGTWVDLTGPVGRGSRAGLRALVGWSAVAVPLVVAASGWALARGRGRALAGRMALGGSLVVAATAGLSHLASGREAGAPVAELRSAGGLAGAALGAPLRAALSAAGGSLVLLVLLAGGALVLTGTSVAAAIHGLGAALRRAARAVPRPRSRPAAAPYDQEHDDDGAPTPRRRPAPPETVAAEVPEPERRPPVAIVVADQAPTAGSQLAIDLGPAAEPGAWKLPPLSLLELSKNEAVDTGEIERRGRVLEDALAQHGVATRLVNMTVGPTVTRYELELGPGVKVARVTSLHKDIAYAMAAPDVRIQAPIPGKSAIGVEVPNSCRQMVRVGDVLCSAEAHRDAAVLTVALGRDIAGRPTLANLATFPHVLIAGQTGAGKSSGINVLLASILARATPEQVLSLIHI